MYLERFKLNGGKRMNNVERYLYEKRKELKGVVEAEKVPESFVNDTMDELVQELVKLGSPGGDRQNPYSMGTLP